MAEFPPALDYLLDDEDSRREYAIVPDAGGQAIAGINSKFFPAQFARIAALPQNERADAVATFYRMNFWNQMRLEPLNSQMLANRVFDFGVNAGARTAIRCLQQAAVSLGAFLTVDGNMGLLTATAANLFSEDTIVAAFREARVARYEQIAEANPAEAGYLSEWKARAQR